MGEVDDLLIMMTPFSSPAYATMLSGRSVPLGQRAKAFIAHLPVPFYLNTCFLPAQALLLMLISMPFQEQCEFIESFVMEKRRACKGPS